MDYKEQIEQAKHAAVKWREKHPIVGVGELRVDCMVDDLTRSITDLLARAEAAEAREEKYKCFFDDVAEKPNCNTCADQKCTYRPNPGEITRFNCPLWRGQKEKIEVRFFDESSKFTEEQWEFIKKRFLKAE